MFLNEFLKNAPAARNIKDALVIGKEEHMTNRQEFNCVVFNVEMSLVSVCFSTEEILDGVVKTIGETNIYYLN